MAIPPTKTLKPYYLLAGSDGPYYPLQVRPNAIVEVNIIDQPISMGNQVDFYLVNKAEYSIPNCTNICRGMDILQVGGNGRCIKWVGGEQVNVN